MSQVDLLYRLQQSENEIREDKKRLAEVIRLQSESNVLLDVREHATSAETKFHRLRAQQNDLNLELDSLNAKTKRSEDRLYSGMVTNPKELEDLQHVIESLGRRIAVLEDELLEVMIAVEEAENTASLATDTLSRVEEEWSDRVERSKEEQATLLRRISELADQKAQIEDLITPEAMKAKQAATRRAGEIAVVALKAGRCRGCLLRVSATQIKAADEGHMVICDNCGRILCPV